MTHLLEMISDKSKKMLDADHFQCLILNREIEFAFFYHFQDSLIYNFNYQDTIIDDVLEQ